jgi:hypothetical protein
MGKYISKEEREQKIKAYQKAELDACNQGCPNMADEFYERWQYLRKILPESDGRYFVGKGKI